MSKTVGCLFKIKMGNLFPPGDKYDNNQQNLGHMVAISVFIMMKQKFNG